MMNLRIAALSLIVSLSVILAGQQDSLVNLARQKFVRSLADELCEEVPFDDSGAVDSYYGEPERDYSSVDCSASYYKCPYDGSEGCKTITTGDCNYYTGEVCTYTTYFDDFVG